MSRAAPDLSAQRRPPPVGPAEAALRESEQRRLLAVEAAGVGDWTYDVATGVLDCSPLARAMHGLGPDEPITIERHDRLIHPEDRAAVQAVRAAAMAPTGSGHYRAEFRFRFADGAVRWIESVGQAVFQGTGVERRATHVLGAMLDITERVCTQRVAERARARAHELQALTAALAATTTPEGAAEVVVPQGMAATGAATGTFALRVPAAADAPAPDGDRAVVLRHAGAAAGAGVSAEGDTFLLTAPGPIAACLRSGEACFLEAREQVLARFPEARDAWDALGTQALAAVPLTVGRETVGAMAFTWATPRALPAELREFLVALGRQAAQALERARLLAAERAARAEAEAARAEAERARADAASTLESIRDAVFTLDAGGRVRYVNHQAERFTGLRREDVLGRVIWELLPPIRGGAFHAAVERAARERTIVAYEAPSVVASGTWVAARVFPTADGGVTVYFHDISERKAVEAERERLLAAERAARAEAEAANRAKSEFLAVMSHELRTPLNAIGGYAELIELGIRGPVTDQQREDLGRIRRSQRHLLGLINEVLNYAKLETGAVRYEVADVRVGDVLAAAEGLVAPQARAKGLTLAVSDCPAELAVRADPDKVRQIVVNLLSNAVKFTDPGGRVTLACAADANGVVRLHVRDTGIGIPADKLGAIFEPFVQVRADLTRPHEGTGLGLAISRDLARAMGGDLTAESAVGAGSVFTLALPSARDAGAAPAAAAGP